MSRPYIQVSFVVDGTLREHRAYIENREELKEVKYHIAPEDDTAAGVVGDNVSVIAFRISPSDKNGLTMYSNAYNQEDGGKDETKNYISVEPRHNDEFQVRTSWSYC
jgi:hypothetical protein